MKIKILTAIIGAALSVFAMAHSGGTNSSGCHVDHQTGVYHCH